MPYQSEFRPGLFAGQTVIVTGGGSGIGRCTAHELAALGAHVAIVGRKVEKLEQVRGEIEEDGGTVSAHPCDIRDEAAVIETVTRVLEQTGRVDGLVNDAGGQYRAGLETISTRGFEAVVKNNLTGGFIFMREVFNRWMKDHGGAIVNIIADISNGWPMFGHSAAARGGMLTLSESAACEWARYGVRVNALAPGGIASSGFEVYQRGGLGRGAQGRGQGADAALRQRVGGLGRHRLPALAGGLVHHRHLPAHRWRQPERTSHPRAQAARSQRRVPGLPSREGDSGLIP